MYLPRNRHKYVALTNNTPITKKTIKIACKDNYAFASPIDR